MAKIWLVDDDQNLTNLMKIALVKQGYEVEIFQDARRCLEEAKKQKPDLILMDLLMPHFSGDEAIIELKKNPDLAQIPLIILTGLLSPEEYRDLTRIAIAGKAYKTLCKPFEIDELLRVVKESLWWCGFHSKKEYSER